MRVRIVDEHDYEANLKNYAKHHIAHVKIGTSTRSCARPYAYYNSTLIMIIN